MVDKVFLRPIWWVRILTFFLSPTVILMVLGTSAVYYHRRSYFPLKGRGWRMLLLMLASMLLFAVINIIAMLTVDTFPSWLFSLAFTLSVVPVVVVYTFRAWRLLFAFKLTQKMVEMNELVEKGMFSQIALMQQNDWFLKHRGWMHGKRFFIAFSIVLWFCIAASCVIIALLQTNGLNELGVALVCSIPMSSALVAAWGLRSFAGDGHYMKLELTEVGATSLSIVVIFGSIFFFAPRPYTSLGPILAHIMYINIMIISGIMPIWVSYSVQRKEKSMRSDWQQPAFLQGILTDPFGVESFMRFAKSEFSTENVLFWRDMEKIHEMHNINDIRDHLKRVYSLYIDDTSSIQVNLPAVVRARVDTAYELLDQVLQADGDNKELDKAKTQDLLQPWLDAQNDIFLLMRKDSLYRYLNSMYYKEYMQQKGAHVDLNVAQEKLENMKAHSQLQEQKTFSHQSIRPSVDHSKRSQRKSEIIVTNVDSGGSRVLSNNNKSEEPESHVGISKDPPEESVQMAVVQTGGESRRLSRGGDARRSSKGGERISITVTAADDHNQLGNIHGPNEDLHRRSSEMACALDSQTVLIASGSDSLGVESRSHS